MNVFDQVKLDAALNQFFCSNAMFHQIPLTFIPHSVTIGDGVTEKIYIGDFIMKAQLKNFGLLTGKRTAEPRAGSAIAKASSKTGWVVNGWLIGNTLSNSDKVSISMLYVRILSLSVISSRRSLTEAQLLYRGKELFPGRINISFSQYLTV